MYVFTRNIQGRDLVRRDVSQQALHAKEDEGSAFCQVDLPFTNTE